MIRTPLSAPFLAMAVLAAAVLALPPGAARAEAAGPVLSGPVLSGPGALASALASARGGETFRLAPGRHDGELHIKGAAWDAPVTVLAHGASVPRFSLGGASNLTIEGLAVEGRPGQKILAYAENVSNLTLRGLTVRGAPDQNGTPQGKGLMVSGARAVTVEGSLFETVKIGVQFLRAEGVRFAGNTVRAMAGDGLNLVMTRDAVIEGNVFRGFVVTRDGHHPDMLQVWTLKDTPPDQAVRDLTIRGNVFDQADGSWTQTMLIQGRGGDLRLRNVLIEGNLIYNSHTHGITVNNAVGVTVRGNTLLEKTDGLTRYRPPRINVFDSEDVVIDRNIAPEVKTDGRVRGRNLLGGPVQLRRRFDDRLRPLKPIDAGSPLTLDSLPQS